MRNLTLCFLVFAMCYTTVNAQYVTIPDPNLMEALLEHGVDTNGDYFISFEEAEAVDSLSMFNQIEDMTGIEAFTNLTYLDIHLKGLSGHQNFVTYLDVTPNQSLEFLDCGYNLLDTLIIGNNDKLLELNCFANGQLSQLDLSGCPNLQMLFCGGNPLEELDISQCTQLDTIYMGEIFTSLTAYVWTLPFPTEGMVVYDEETDISYVDIVAPSISLMSEHVFEPRLMEFSSNEDGIAYLLSSGTLDNMDDIRAECIDSLEVTAGVVQSFDLSSTDLTTLWIQAADITLNISEAEVFTLSGVGIRNNPDLSVEIFPNPASELLTIRSNMKTNHSVEIASVSGQIIYSETCNEDAFSIDVKDLKKGLYFLRISDGQTILTRKFIKL